MKVMNKALENEILLIQKEYPNFKVSKQVDKFIISGLLEILKFGDYEIEIDIPIDYPKSHPIIREIGEDIPKINDRHINGDGTCCIAIKYRITRYLQEDRSIVNFIETKVKPFFANQLYFEATGTWINGEYSHGIEGIYEYISEELQIEVPLIKRLTSIAKKSIINWNKTCPCGSMKSIKKCHKLDIVKIKKIIFE